MPTTRIAIAEDQALFRSALISLLNDIPTIKVVLEAENGQDLLDKLQRQDVDLILMDLKMPILDGAEATQKVKQLYPHIKILMLTMYDEDSLILHTLEVGAHGYLVKNITPQELSLAINSVTESGHYFSDRVSKAMLAKIAKHDGLEYNKYPKVEFSPRELEVLELICREYTTKEIADKLFRSHRTVDSHRQNMMDKIGAKNTAGLVVYAMRHNLVNLD